MKPQYLFVGASFASLVIAALSPNITGTWTACILAIAFAVMGKPSGSRETAFDVPDADAETHESDDAVEIDDDPIEVVAAIVNRDIKAIPKDDGSGDIDRLEVTPGSTFCSVTIRKGGNQFNFKVSEEDAYVVKALLAGVDVPPPPVPEYPEPTA